MTNEETMTKAAADLRKKAAAGAAILENETREAVKMQELYELVLEVLHAPNKQAAMIEAFLTMYHAGANAGAAVERRNKNAK